MLGTRLAKKMSCQAVTSEVVWLMEVDWKIRKRQADRSVKPTSQRSKEVVTESRRQICILLQAQYCMSGILKA